MDRPFCNDKGNGAPDVENPMDICCGYLDTGVTQALPERFPKNWMIGGVEC
jgi:hypothetical protein